MGVNRRDLLTLMSGATMALAGCNEANSIRDQLSSNQASGDNTGGEGDGCSRFFQVITGATVPEMREVSPLEPNVVIYGPSTSGLLFPKSEYSKKEFEENAIPAFEDAGMGIANASDVEVCRSEESVRSIVGFPAEPTEEEVGVVFDDAVSIEREPHPGSEDILLVHSTKDSEDLLFEQADKLEVGDRTSIHIFLND